MLTDAYEIAVADAMARELRTRCLLRGDAAEVAEIMHRAMIDVSGVATVYDFSRLWAYRPEVGVWEVVTEESVNRMTRTLAGQQIEVGKDEKGEPKFRTLKVGGALWRDTFAALEADPTERDGFFCGATGLTFANGHLEITASGARLRPHSWEHRSRHAYPLEWDPDASCDRWYQAMGEWGLDDPTQAVLAEFVGSALVGHATQAGRWLMLHGPGGNGKSVAVKVVEGLFPDKWRSSVPVQDLGAQFIGTYLVDKRLNSVSDLESKDLLHTGRLKAIVTGDKVMGEVKNGPHFTLYPQAGLMFAVNEKPAVSDTSDGFWSRVMVVDFLTPFRGTTKQVEALEEHILFTERAGLIAWAVGGAVRRLRDGWTPRDESSRDAWRQDEDPVKSWLLDRSEEWPSTSTAASTLFDDYKSWTRRVGKGTLSMTKWGRRMKEILGPDGSEKTRDGRFYRVELRPHKGLSLVSGS